MSSAWASDRASVGAGDDEVGLEFGDAARGFGLDLGQAALGAELGVLGGVQLRRDVGGARGAARAGGVHAAEDPAQRSSRAGRPRPARRRSPASAHSDPSSLSDSPSGVDRRRRRCAGSAPVPRRCRCRRPGRPRRSRARSGPAAAGSSARSAASTASARRWLSRRLPDVRPLGVGVAADLDRRRRGRRAAPSEIAAITGVLSVGDGGGRRRRTRSSSRRGSRSIRATQAASAPPARRAPAAGGLASAGGGCAVKAMRRFARPALGGGVVGDRAGLAVAARTSSASGRPLRAQRGEHRLGALLAEPQVAGIRSPASRCGRRSRRPRRGSRRAPSPIAAITGALVCGELGRAGVELDRGPSARIASDRGGAGSRRRSSARPRSASSAAPRAAGHRAEVELDAAVARPAGLGGVVGDRAVGAVAAGGRGRPAAGPRPRSASTTASARVLAELRGWPSAGALRIGMAGDLELGARAAAQHVGDRGDHPGALGHDVGGAGGERIEPAVEDGADLVGADLGPRPGGERRGGGGLGVEADVDHGAVCRPWPRAAPRPGRRRARRGPSPRADTGRG